MPSNVWRNAENGLQGLEVFAKHGSNVWRFGETGLQRLEGGGEIRAPLNRSGRWNEDALAGVDGGAGGKAVDGDQGFAGDGEGHGDEVEGVAFHDDVGEAKIGGIAGEAGGGIAEGGPLGIRSIRPGGGDGGDEGREGGEKEEKRRAGQAAGQEGLEDEGGHGSSGASRRTRMRVKRVSKRSLVTDMTPESGPRPRELVTKSAKLPVVTRR